MVNKFFDLHCDAGNNYTRDIQFLTSGIRGVSKYAYDFSSQYTENDLFCVDYPSMKEVNVSASLFFIHVPLNYDGHSLHHLLDISESIRKNIETKNSNISIVENLAAYSTCINKGKMAIIIGVENSDVFCRNLNIIHALYRYGIRVCTLAWYGRNCVCDAGHESNEGLSWFGKQAVKLMKELGMLIDISHLNTKGIYDVLDITLGQGVFATHSNCFNLCKTARNLNDDIMKKISEIKSCMGITFVPHLLNESGIANIEDVGRHIHHAVEVMNIDSVAIGTDYDGHNGRVTGLERINKIGKLKEYLSCKGFSEEDINKIFFSNADNFLKKNLHI
ncbi:MAG: membrane dipeptidase [Oligoflexia bacterium]|nr:membrane dipeptidase [Oligoflexia bacterium]